MTKLKNKKHYIMKCDCGNLVTRRADSFNQKKRKAPYSCGCKNVIDMIGRSIGKLTVISELPRKRYESNHTERIFLCQCDCSGTVEVTYSNFVNSAVKECSECRLVDPIGKTYGDWYVIREVERYISPGTNYEYRNFLVKCSCGLEKEMILSSLTSAKNGCLECLKEKEDITGNKYGMLTAIKKSKLVTHPGGQSSWMWECHCDCGKILDVSRKSLIKGGNESCGCSSMSKGERRIHNFLELHGTNYTSELRISECRNIRPLPFDFCIYNNDGSIQLLVEYDGQQHFRKLEHDTDETFNQRLINDGIKDKYCKDNNIKLLRIPYNKYNHIESILLKELNIKKE